MTTIVFVPGGWHSPECFRAVADILAGSGYQTELVYLPSHNPSQEVLHQGFWPDVAAVREAIIKAVDAGQKVIVFMHSNSGTFGPDAAYDLEWKTRQQKGLHGGVTHLIFCAATIVPAGMSNASMGDGKFPEWMVPSEDGLTFTVNNPKEIFYHDCPAEIADKWVANLVPQASTVFTTEVVHETWKFIPSTYLMTMHDRTSVSPAVQDYFVNEIGKGCNIRVEKMETGHSPFLVKPEETAAVIQRAAEIPIS